MSSRKFRSCLHFFGAFTLLAPYSTWGQVSPGFKDSATCETERRIRSDRFLKDVLQPPASSPIKSFDDFRDPRQVDFFAMAKCQETLMLGSGEEAEICTKGYVHSINALMASDDITASACSLVAKTSDEVKKCDQGQAGCIRIAAEGFAKAKDLLDSGSMRAREAERELKGIRSHAVQVAGAYALQLTTIGRTLAKLKAEGKPLEDPALDAQTQQWIGMSVDKVMNEIQVPDR